MPTVGLVLKRQAPQARSVGRRVVEWLLQHGHTPVAESEDAQALGLGDVVVDKRAMLATARAVVVLGGDGTFLATARLAGPREVPLIGVNLGGLGFLTEVHEGDLLATLERTLAGQATLERRRMLRATVTRADGASEAYQALNDAVLSRGALGRTIEIEARVDGGLLAVFKADGLIVATPTGSTAYSLSAGGPIVPPSVEVLLISPICPHTLGLRPIVLDDRVRLALRLRTDGEVLLLTLDGQESVQLGPADLIEITRSPYEVSVVRSPELSFFDLLRAKFGWGSR